MTLYTINSKARRAIRTSTTDERVTSDDISYQKLKNHRVPDFYDFSHPHIFIFLHFVELSESPRWIRMRFCVYDDTRLRIWGLRATGREVLLSCVLRDIERFRRRKVLQSSINLPMGKNQLINSGKKKNVKKIAFPPLSWLLLALVEVYSHHKNDDSRENIRGRLFGVLRSSFHELFVWSWWFFFVHQRRRKLLMKENKKTKNSRKISLSHSPGIWTWVEIFFLIFSSLRNETA